MVYCRPQVVALSIAIISSFVAAPYLAKAQDMPPGAVVVMESTFAPIEPAGPFQVVQLVVDLPPSTIIPLHVHGGPAYVTVLEGEVVYSEAGRDTRYRPGDSWVEAPGVPGSAVNPGAVPVRLLATYLLPIGAPLTTLIDP